VIDARFLKDLAARFEAMLAVEVDQVRLSVHLEAPEAARPRHLQHVLDELVPEPISARLLEHGDGSSYQPSTSRMRPAARWFAAILAQDVMAPHPGRTVANGSVVC
jgi:hypothetical protein